MHSDTNFKSSYVTSEANLQFQLYLGYIQERPHLGVDDSDIKLALQVKLMVPLGFPPRLS